MNDFRAVVAASSSRLTSRCRHNAHDRAAIGHRGSPVTRRSVPAVGGALRGHWVSPCAADGCRSRPATDLLRGAQPLRLSWAGAACPSRFRAGEEHSWAADGPAASRPPWGGMQVRERVAAHSCAPAPALDVLHLASPRGRDPSEVTTHFHLPRLSPVDARPVHRSSIGNAGREPADRFPRSGLAHAGSVHVRVGVRSAARGSEIRTSRFRRERACGVWGVAGRARLHRRKIGLRAGGGGIDIRRPWSLRPNSGPRSTLALDPAGRRMAVKPDCRLHPAQAGGSAPGLD